MKLLLRAEWAIAVLLTMVAISLHYAFASHAGGLWRDEANTVALATVGTFPELWQHLQFDSFPLGWLVTVRALGALGWTSDPNLRTVGASIGIGIVLALWFQQRCFRVGPPLISIVLLAFCPSLIIWGDSMRAYGAGILTALLALGLQWRLAETPSVKRWCWATLAAVIAVQITYYNCVVVLAAGLAGVAVAGGRGRWRDILWPGASGMVAALSIIPYFPVMRRAAGWNMLVQLPSYDLRLFCTKLMDTLSGTGPATPWLWLAWLVAAVVLGAIAFVRREDSTENAIGRDQLLFAATCLGVTLISYFAFLRSLRYPTQAWYYLILLAVVAACVEAIFQVVCVGKWKRAARLGGVIACFVIFAANMRTAIPMRMTNVDLVADALRERTKPRDFIIVSPWYCGISYARYHSASAGWSTVPPVSDHRFHRYDEIKAHMENENQALPVSPLLTQIQQTLQAGGRVYLVGGFHFLPEGASPPTLPPAPRSPSGWSDGLYLEVWSMQVAAFLQKHAMEAEVLPTIEGEGAKTNPFENLPLIIVKGWRD